MSAARQDLEAQVVALSGRGLGQRRIARTIGVSRGLVCRILRRRKEAALRPHTALPDPAIRAPRTSKLDAFESRIRELLSSYPQITAQRILEELRAGGYDGGYSILKARVQRLRPAAPIEPSRVRPEIHAGEEGEQDWSPQKVGFEDGPRTMHTFLLTLSFSRARYPDFFDGEDLFALLEGHRRAFDEMRGVPARIKYDNQRAVVARREGPDVIYQPHLLAFAAHYGFEPVAVRPRRPNDKAIVERDLFDVERSFLCGRRFRDTADLRERAKKWIVEVVLARRHPKMKDRTVGEVFEAMERPALRPLPSHPFDTARVVYRLCSIDGFVSWDGNRYSVPYEHVTALLPVRVTQTEVFVYGPDLSCVARHERLPRGAGREVVVPAHRPPRREGAGASVDLVRGAFLALCDEAASFLHGLVGTQPRSAAYHARRILELRERYSAADVAAALGHAARFQAFSHAAVARILEVRAQPRTLEEYVAAETADKLRGLLGAERLRPRDLRSYDRKPERPTEETTRCADPEKKTDSKPE